MKIVWLLSLIATWCLSCDEDPEIRRLKYDLSRASETDWGTNDVALIKRHHDYIIGTRKTIPDTYYLCYYDFELKKYLFISIDVRRKFDIEDTTFDLAILNAQKKFNSKGLSIEYIYQDSTAVISEMKTGYTYCLYKLPRDVREMAIIKRDNVVNCHSPDSCNL